jgi:hypothetical protein
MKKEDRRELRFKASVHHGIKKRIKSERRATRHNIKEQLKEIAREESDDN